MTCGWIAWSSRGDTTDADDSDDVIPAVGVFCSGKIWPVSDTSAVVTKWYGDVHVATMALGR